ncbi:MAG: BMC domain-containing protein [Myxococcota bacterium]
MADALAVLELSSIARGLHCIDALVKRAEVSLLRADPVTPGKYLIVFEGGVEEVRESLEAAREDAVPFAIDHLLLPQVHPALRAALDELSPAPLGTSLGILELATVASTIAAADRALKCTSVALVAIHLARGIDGKGYLAFTGAQHDVEASLDAGDEAVAPAHRVGRELIANPHPDFDWALTRL